jgi:hypothetical protein
LSTTEEQSNDTPWRDEERLRRMYWEEEMSSQDIADELGCSYGAVLRWMDKHDIPRRDRLEASHLSGCLEAAREARRVDWVPYTISNGYEIWRDSATGNEISVHQLLAIANGADPHDVFRDGMVAHHRSGHRRDNRPENIEVMERGEHTLTHMESEWVEEDGIPVLVPPEKEET